MSKKKDEKEAKIKVKEIKKKDLKEDDVKDEKKVKKSKKGMIIAVVILSILVVALGTTVAFLLYRNSLENKTTGTGWSDKYYEFLREQKKSKNNNSAIIDGSDISFVNAKSMEDPMMIVTNNTELDGKDAISLSVFGIVDDKVKYLTGQTGPIEEAKFYYDIENKEYKYYIHSHSDNYDRYISLDTIKYDYDNYNIQKEMEKKGITDYNSEEYSQMTQDLLKRQQEDSTREELTFSGADSKVVQKTLDGKELEYNKVDEKIVDTNVKPDSFEYKKGQKFPQMSFKKVLSSKGLTSDKLRAKLTSNVSNQGPFLIILYPSKLEKHNKCITFFFYNGVFPSITFSQNLDESDESLIIPYNFRNTSPGFKFFER